MTKMVSSRSERSLPSTCHPERLGAELAKLNLSNPKLTQTERETLIRETVARLMIETLQNRTISRALLTAYLNRNRREEPIRLTLQ
jgi:hypothetical protein